MPSFCGTVVRYFAAAEVGFYWQQMCSFLRRSEKPLFLLVGMTGNERSLVILVLKCLEESNREEVCSECM